MNSTEPVVSPPNSPPKALIRPPRANVMGVGVHALNMQSAVEFVEASVSSGSRGYVCVTGVHGVMEAQRSAEFRRILDEALLVMPDGTPTVWVGRLQKHDQMKRVFGPDFMEKTCARSVRNGHTHFLYGGKPGIVGELRQKLERRFPGIRIVGTFTPPFRTLNHQEQTDLEDTFAELT